MFAIFQSAGTRHTKRLEISSLCGLSCFNEHVGLLSHNGLVFTLITISTHEVKSLFDNLDPHKAPGPWPDNINEHRMC